MSLGLMTGEDIRIDTQNINIDMGLVDGNAADPSAIPGCITQGSEIYGSVCVKLGNKLSGVSQGQCVVRLSQYHGAVHRWRIRSQRWTNVNGSAVSIAGNSKIVLEANMRQKLNYPQLIPRVYGCLTVVLMISFVIAPLSAFGSTHTSRNRPEKIGEQTTLPMMFIPGSVISPITSASPYEISPSGAMQGTDPEVTVTSTQCVQDASRKPIGGLQLRAPESSGITVTGTSTTNCLLTAKLSIAANAPFGIVKLRLTKADAGKNQVLQDVIDFAVTGIAQGPIPPGLNNQGQVDVMWSVLPDEVVHDNFGAKVATEYFCIEAVIGNDSGYDIQLASIGFTVPSFSAGNPNGPQYRIPNAGYRIVRGTLQRRELLSPRNLILNGIKVAGPLLTGFTPFFHVLAHKANFAEMINIISNPLEKGFEQAVPDTVPGQVDRLGDITYRDDISTRTIVPNNIQTRITTFVPKEILFPGMKGKTPIPGEDRKKPMDVMHKLGDIVIIGEQIQHVNRIRVVSTGLSETPAPTPVPTPSPSPSPSP
jgi:hypothetical protein